MREETVKQIKKLFAIKWVIYIMLVLSIFFYFIITVTLKKMGVKVGGDFGMTQIIQYVFIALSALILLAALYIRRPLSDPVHFLIVLEKRVFEPTLAEKFSEKIDHNAATTISKVMLLSNSIDIVSWALCESIAIFGLFLFILSGNILYVQAFGGAALLMLAFSRPDFAMFMNLIDAALAAESRDSEG